MPCMELFEAQPQEYREQVLRAGLHGAPRGRAGREHELVEVGGSDGDVLGLDRFGASAPGAKVLEKLGFSVENIAARAASAARRRNG